MGITEQQQELIDRYLRGELNEEALDAFHKALKDHPAMEEALRSQTALAQGIEFYGNEALRRRFQKISDEVKREPLENNTRNKRLIRLLLSAAAIAILLICCFFFFQKPDPEKWFAQFYEPVEFSITRNGEVSEPIAQVEYFYNQGDYKAAIPVFQDILNKQPEHLKVRLTLGNAFILTGRNEDAIRQFQSIMDRNDPLYTDQARWFAALVYLKTGRLAKSKPLLNALAGDEEADFHEKAKALLILMEE